MKKFLLIHLVFIFSANTLFGQSVDEYNKKIDSLNMILEEVELKINELNGRKKEIRRLLY